MTHRIFPSPQFTGLSRAISSIYSLLPTPCDLHTCLFLVPCTPCVSSVKRTLGTLSALPRMVLPDLLCTFQRSSPTHRKIWIPSPASFRPQCSYPSNHAFPQQTSSLTSSTCQTVILQPTLNHLLRISFDSP